MTGPGAQERRSGNDNAARLKCLYLYTSGWKRSGKIVKKRGREGGKKKANDTYGREG